MKQVREFLRKKSLRVPLMVAMLVCALASVACATEGGTSSSAVTSAFQTGFQQMSADALSMIAIIVPIAIGVAGVIFVARKAMGWFKSLAK